MIINKMAAILVANNLGTLGVNIFTHFMPVRVTTGILILPRLSGELIDYDLPGMRRGGFQVVVRVPDYDEALINSIIPLLTIDGKVVDGLDIKYIHPRHDPVVYPATDGNNIEYSVNFDAVYAKT